MKQVWKWSRRSRTASSSEARLSLVELETAVQSVEPAVRLAPPRLLRRVVRIDAKLPGLGFRVPHSKSYVISSTALLEIADRDELGLPPDAILPPIIILLERPSAADLEEQSREELLLHYWELLFHARIHKEFDDLRARGRLGKEELLRRAAEFDLQEIDEIRNVLRQERFLLPPYDDATVYVEFAAVYLGMRHFKPFFLPSFFPALKSLDEVDRRLARDIDAAALLAATRLPGAPDPCDLFEAERRAAEEFDADPLAAESSKRAAAPGRGVRSGASGRRRGKRPARQRSERNYLIWSRRAERQAARGNFAGAVIRRARAESWVPCEKAAEAATALRDEIHHFVARLQSALGTEGEDPRPWRESLLALAHQAPRSLWTVEARLLYDLQKACIDQERPTFTVDVMHWVLSLGRRAIRRDLPDQRRVAMSRHLGSAERRLRRVAISDRQRRQLACVLGAATRAAEANLREGLRPKIVAALDAIELTPKNFPEEVSRQKIVEELLDRILERGFLTLGEVRDAISRNQLKEPDCAGPRSFLRGEAALRANSQLTDTLDGVFQPGDFYLRWILRFSHLTFGSSTGRWITKYLVLPFGGALVTLIVVEHLVHMVTHHENSYTPTWNVPTSYVPTFLVASIIFGLIHVPRFRGLLEVLLRMLGRGLKFVLFDFPRAVLSLPWVEMLSRSAVARLFINAIVKPLVPTVIVARFVPADWPTWQKIIGLGSMYAGLLLLATSRTVRLIEELAWDAIAEGWQRFGVRPLVGLFWLILDVFQRIMQGIEQVLYTVDEWLRFRAGERRATFVIKGALGVVWFFVAYIIRFCVSLLIEPQVNPLKHIPWVTAAAKVVWSVGLSSGLEHTLADKMGHTRGRALFTAIMVGTPGIFGFLIWELKENWRLFAANRPKNLEPALIGSHGETMLRLLRPGIHSGTIPKRFGKLRRAERKSLSGGDRGAVRKHRELLHHVEVDLHRYIEREFIAWFEQRRGWTGPPPQLAEVHLATNAATIVAKVPEAVDGPLVMSFRLVAGVIQLDLAGRLCLERVPAAAADVFRLALLNLLKTAGVDVLNRGERPEATDNVSSRQIVGLVAVPWWEWVEAWENTGSASESRWDVLPAA